jgi:hypothetical protein
MTRKLQFVSAITLVLVCGASPVFAQTTYQLDCECEAVTRDGKVMNIPLGKEQIAEEATAGHTYKHALQGSDSELGITCAMKGGSIKNEENEALEAAVISGSVELKGDSTYDFSFDPWSRHVGGKYKLSGLSLKTKKGEIKAVVASCKMKKA